MRRKDVENLVNAAIHELATRVIEAFASAGIEVTEISDFDSRGVRTRWAAAHDFAAGAVYSEGGFLPMGAVGAVEAELGADCAGGCDEEDDHGGVPVLAGLHTVVAEAPLADERGYLVVGLSDVSRFAVDGGPVNGEAANSHFVSPVRSGLSADTLSSPTSTVQEEGSATPGAAAGECQCGTPAKTSEGEGGR